MEVETLKKIAEGLGYTAKIFETTPELVSIKIDEGCWAGFKTENFMLSIEDWVIRVNDCRLFYDEGARLYFIYQGYDDKPNIGNDKNLTEVILKAAEELVNESK